jgi:hypothetical protein
LLDKVLLLQNERQDTPDSKDDSEGLVRLAWFGRQEDGAHINDGDDRRCRARCLVHPAFRGVHDDAGDSTSKLDSYEIISRAQNISWKLRTNDLSHQHIPPFEELEPSILWV